MKIGIIAAMPQELKILVDPRKWGKSFCVLEKSTIQDRLDAMRSFWWKDGIGKVMSAMSVAVLANDFKVEAIINTGCRCRAPGMAVGDIVLANKLAYHDVDGQSSFGYKVRSNGRPTALLNLVAISYQK